MSNKKFAVAIWYGLSKSLPKAHTLIEQIDSGGGIGGLACATALSRIPDVDVTIYEAAHDLSEVGAGIGMSPRTWKIFKALGVDKELSQLTRVPPEDHIGECRIGTCHQIMLIFRPAEKIFLLRKGDQLQGRNVADLTMRGIFIMRIFIFSQNDC